MQQQKQQDAKHQQELEAIEARAAMMRSSKKGVPRMQQEMRCSSSSSNSRTYAKRDRLRDCSKMTQFDSTPPKGEGTWRTLGQRPEEAEPSREDTSKAAERYMSRRAEMFAHMNPREQAQRQGDFQQAQDDPNASTI